ncbi:MAG: FixH family protein [Vicinamibacterales bacterium]
MRIEMNWGTGIALAYTTFAVATTGFVAFAMGRSVDLVSPDYYAESLRQDQRMDAERNARTLQPAPRIRVIGRVAEIVLPPAHAPMARGTITFYRPSDSHADKVFLLALSTDGEQRLQIDQMQIGSWLVQVRWTVSGRDYYVEQPVFVQ